jgi:penicillin amidase
MGAPGSYDTVNNGYWTWRSGKFSVFGEPPMRMIIDMSDMGKSVAINAPGESGHPFSSNYSDQLNEWLGCGYHVLTWTKDQDVQSAVHRLVLNP